AAGTFYDFGSELFPALMREREPVLGIVHEGYWNDIGTHEELRRGTFAVLAGELDGRQQLSDTVGEPAQVGVLIHDTAEVDDSVVLTAPCVIGPRARVGAGARIARSIVLPGGVVPAGALLAGATYGTVEGLAAWSASLADTAAHDAPTCAATSGNASS
ncbi:MAG: NDP-sugar synthase, partial [Thermoleophilia bacterium]|nr:NDP-sugar synthase [Thermoleophilia bacterium]